MPGVLLVAEASGEQLAPTTAELVGEGVRLAADMGGPVTVLLAGKNVQGLAASLGQLGAEKVLVADSQSPTPPSPQWVLSAAEQTMALERSQADRHVHGVRASARDPLELLAPPRLLRARREARSEPSQRPRKREQRGVAAPQPSNDAPIFGDPRYGWALPFISSGKLHRRS